MTPITFPEKPQAINLDCSTRAKIVIHTKLPTSKRPIGPTVSIFNQKNRNASSLDCSATSLETPVQGLGMQVQAPLPQPVNNPSQHSPRPSSLTQKMMHPKTQTIEDSKVKKQRTTSTSPHRLPTTVPFQERKISPLPSRLRISNTPSSATLTLEPAPAKHTPLSVLPTSQYAEEYAKCPCTKGRAEGRPPCDRCQLMLLADRFCDLIDVQCQKWGIPPKQSRHWHLQ